MSLFDRYWKLKAVGEDFDFTIEQDKFGQSLRMSFEISASTNLRYYSGVIKIYNFAPTKRKQLAYNLLLEKFGDGPGIELEAGYKGRSGLIFNGVVNRGYTIRDPLSGDWITVLRVGLPYKQDKQTVIEPWNAQSVEGDLYNYISQAVDKIFDQGRFISIKRGPKYKENLRNAVNEYLGSRNKKNKSNGYSGPAMQVLEEISQEFNLLFFVDHQGLNVASYDYGNAADTPIIIDDAEIEIGDTTGLIGSPTYTDAGIKLISYLRPELRLFQSVIVNSKSLFIAKPQKEQRKITILELIHRGDTHSEEWYSEIDGAAFNQFKQEFKVS